MKRTFLALATGFALLVVPGSPVAASGEAPPQVAPGRVDGATARALVAAGAKVVDVRTADEFATGHVPGAILIPYDELPRRAAEIGPPSTKVVLYCRSGRRSAIALEALRKAGYANVYDLGSASAWPGELVK